VRLQQEEGDDIAVLVSCARRRIVCLLAVLSLNVGLYQPASAHANESTSSELPMHWSLKGDQPASDIGR
jgi:hypothetical protein